MTEDDRIVAAVFHVICISIYIRVFSSCILLDRQRGEVFFSPSIFPLDKDNDAVCSCMYAIKKVAVSATEASSQPASLFAPAIAVNNASDKTKL